MYTHVSKYNNDIIKGKKKIKLKLAPEVPATWADEAGGSLEPRSMRPAWLRK
jgi:hypothetical protein